MATSTRRKAATRQELAKAVSHSLRSEILTELSKRPASPSELQELFPGEKLESLSYHCKRLADLHCAEVVDKEQVRGWMKTTYRATVRNFVKKEDTAIMHPAVADHYAGQVWREVVGAMKQATESGSLEAQGDLHLTCTTDLMLDEQAWQEGSELHDELQEKMMELAAESVARLMKTGEQGIPVASSQLFFKLPAR